MWPFNGLSTKDTTVVACCLDVGESKDLDIVYKKALDMGAVGMSYY
ncbi:hypothetical protein ACVQ9Z_12965 [Staphylococcus aureus]